MDGDCFFPTSMFDGKLKVIWELGEGSHGEVLLVKDSSWNQFSVKASPAESSSGDLLKHEYEVYKHLRCTQKKISGLPQVFKYGFDHVHGKNVLVMSRHGASMRDVMKLNRGHIPHYAVLRIGCQLIRRLRYIHSMDLLHGDIKPRNILCGYKTFEKVYLVDFGLAEFYKMKNGKHRRLIAGQNFKGTREFASRNAHKGYSLSRRDDLESLGFTLIYMMTGKLPWSKFPDQTASIPNFEVLEEDLDYMNTTAQSWEKLNISAKKENTAIDVLCNGVPACLRMYMKYVYGLHFEQDPDYSLLIRNMKRGMRQLQMMGKENNGNELDIWPIPYESDMFMRARKEEDVWADFDMDDGEEKECDANNSAVKQGEDAFSCTPFSGTHASKENHESDFDNLNERSEVSTIQPHPVLRRNSRKLWTATLRFFRIFKQHPETVLLHYSDDGFRFNQEERDW